MVPVLDGPWWHQIGSNIITKKKHRLLFFWLESFVFPRHFSGIPFYCTRASARAAHRNWAYGFFIPTATTRSSAVMALSFRYSSFALAAFCS